jgi:hypothetical protein
LPSQELSVLGVKKMILAMHDRYFS